MLAGIVLKKILTPVHQYQLSCVSTSNCVHISVMLVLTSKMSSSFRFGFLPSSVQVPDSAVMPEDVKNLNHQYVHCTVGMFILIPVSTPACSTSGLKPSASTPGAHNVVETASHSKSYSDLHRLYFSRQGRPESVVNQVGFLWSWNYMSSRRWRSGNTGDECFQDTVLADFRKFCSNQDNRLFEFWESFRHSVDLQIS